MSAIADGSGRVSLRPLGLISYQLVFMLVGIGVRGPKCVVMTPPVPFPPGTLQRMDAPTDVRQLRRRAISDRSPIND